MLESNRVAESDANQTQVRRVIESKAFRTSEVHRSLLNYLAEKSLAGDADSLKEYTVGLDVFQKPESYDPRQESVVRMHMSRLRQKLAEYYRTEGLEDPVIVDVPKGAFKVTFEPRPVLDEPVPTPFVSVAPQNSNRTLAVMGLLLALAAGAALYLGVRLSQVERASVPALPSVWTPELRLLWEPLLSADRPLVVCLATQPSSNLTGLATANGAFLLGQFLADRKQNVYLTGSDDLSMPEISMSNVVYLGPMNTSRQLQALPVKFKLVLEANGIRNTQPQAGEQEFYADAAKSSLPDESYALVTYAPGLTGKGGVLYLSGHHVSSVPAGVQAFTEPQLARTLVTKMQKDDGKLPRFYQVLLKVRSMEDTPVEVTYVLHKELAATGKAHDN